MPVVAAINQENFAAILRLIGKLKAVREKQGLCFAEVATRMGIDVLVLDAMETGKNLNPSLPTLCKWAEALGQQLNIDLTAS